MSRNRKRRQRSGRHSSHPCRDRCCSPFAVADSDWRNRWSPVQSIVPRASMANIRVSTREALRTDATYSLKLCWSQQGRVPRCYRVTPALLRKLFHRIPESQRHSTSVILPFSTLISKGPHGFGNRFSASWTT